MEDREIIEDIEDIKEEPEDKNVIIINDDLKTVEEKPKRLSKIFAGVAFGLSIFSIFLAILFDFISFKDAILTFVAGTIVAGIIFVVLCIGFLASFILIFGFYLVKEHGFWPLNLSINIYKEILGDVAKAAQGQTDGFIALRFVLIGICAAILILGIIARVYYRKDREKGLAKITENTKGFANAAITLSSIGIGVSSAMIAIVSSL